MERRIFLCWMVLCFCVGCQGLELTISYDWSLGGRKGCGVILCEEIFQKSRIPGNATSSSSTSRGDPAPSGDLTVSSDIILKMQLFKHAHDSTQECRGHRDNGPSKRLVAFLTPEQPRLTRVANGVSVDGQLTATGATLKLGLYKWDDCRTDFTCEVIRVDSQGNNQVTNSHLVQQQMLKERRLLGGGGALGGASDMTLTLISMLHEIDNKLVQTGLHSDDNFLSRVQALENRFEDKLAAIENRLEDKVESIENRFGSKLDRFENRLIDKMASLEKDLQYGLEKFEGKLEDRVHDQMKTVSSEISKAIVGEASQFELVLKKSMEESFTTLKQNFQTTEDKIFVKVDSVNLNMQTNLNTTTAAITTLQNSLNLQQRLNLSDGDCSKNLKETLQSISTAIRKSTQSLKDQLGDVNQNLEQKFQQFSTAISNSNNNNTRLGCSNLHDLLSQTQANISDNIQATITETLTLKTCEKNGISVLPHPSYLYPVVSPNNETPFDFPYLCDTFTDDGGWIVIQRRSSGQVDFFRTWDEYKNGFGSLDDDFWLGNEKIYAITNSATYELRITLKFKGVTKYAHYSSFSLSNERSNYILNLGTYDGTANDSLSALNGRQFSTKDRDNDSHPTVNCATEFQGAWWYDACHASNLNGKWGASGYKGPSWNVWTKSEPTTFTEMKIRRVDNS